MTKGGMMRKILVLSLFALMFIACNFATDAAKLKPDLEVTFINPLAATLYVADTVSGTSVSIESIEFEPFEMAIYMKIPGIVYPDSITTYSILNIPLAADKVARHMLQNNLLVTKTYIGLVSEDDYGMGKTDTAWVWFGFNFINQ
jgi:hypothetical protein